MHIATDTYLSTQEMFNDLEVAEQWVEHTPAVLLAYLLPNQWPEQVRHYVAAAAAAARASDAERLCNIMSAIRNYYCENKDGAQAPYLVSTMAELWVRGLDWEVWQEFKRHVL